MPPRDRLICGCEWDWDSPERHYCKGPYTLPRAQLRGPGERLPEHRCTCTRLRKYQHTSAMECEMAAFTLIELDEFMRRTGCGPQTARHLLWLEKEFAQP